MSDQTMTEGTDLEQDEDAEAAPVRKRFPGKKLVLFIVLPMFLVAGGGASAYFSGLLDGLLGLEQGEEQGLAAKPRGPATYFEMPEMLVNLNGSGKRVGYLKISVSLELGSEKDVETIEKVMPRIVDNFQVYLRELRIEDLRGSAGLQRLREELLTRVASAAEPAEVRDVLFREMLIQ
ncbi:MAG TPA: flagellar basal body-associated FliL family protein [Kiloniellales bacterium]|nr:flagellar basal body-associated FliL family protein [Kiloniellales bacterium]